MFKRLLVPLDGSTLAEAVLPATVYLAQILGARVTLIHIIERNAPPEIHGDRHLTDPTDARHYLQAVPRRTFPAGIRVEQHVHSSQVSDVARTITEHVSEFASDLIIMCTHGQGGLRSWLFGSIAQQVISLGVTPILLIQPTQSGSAPSFACRQLLVLLDGDPDHEQALPVATRLAQSCGSKIHLVIVVPTLPTLPKEQAATAKLLPSATTALLDLTQQNAEAYLARREKQLQAAGLLVTAQVSRGDPATTIAQTRQQIRADLVVLGTHGKKGADAFWSESVAPKLTSRFSQPLLLVPVHR